MSRAYCRAQGVGLGYLLRAKAEKRNPQPDDNGLIHWETMLPVFSLLSKTNFIFSVNFHLKAFLGESRCQKMLENNA